MPLPCHHSQPFQSRSTKELPFKLSIHNKQPDSQLPTLHYTIMSPTFQSIYPSLPVTSIPDSIDYYCKVLGFRVAGRDRDDHTWLQLPSDESEDKYKVAVNVYLRSASCHSALRGRLQANADRSGRGFPNIENDVQFGLMYIRVAGDEKELETLLETFKSRNVIIQAEITEKPWGLRDFTVQGTS